MKSKNIFKNNISLRILVGIISIPLIIMVSIFGGYYFLILTLLISFFSLYELFLLFDSNDINPFRKVVIIYSIVSIIILFNKFDLLIYILLGLIFLLIIIEVLRKKNERNIINILFEIFSFIYIVMPLILFNKILSIKNFNYVLLIFLLIWISDTFAFFGGKLFGKHKLSYISPKKTIEGSIIGFIFPVFITIIYFYFISVSAFKTDCLIISILIGIFGQVGDLFESFLKRQNNIKDSSNIIPGHGGFLDRFDSIVFVIPVIYSYLFYFKSILKIS
jgi:phosphatidate cytidylyltransferase